MSSLTMSSENGDVSVILKCLSIVIHWCLKMFMNCNSLVPVKNTLSIWTCRWYMWWRSMSTLSFQWTSPGYWQKHSDVWSSLIRVISLSHAKNKITWIISMFLYLQSLSYWCCSDFRLIAMTANFASPRSLSTITRWLFQIFKRSWIAGKRWKARSIINRDVVA